MRQFFKGTAGRATLGQAAIFRWPELIAVLGRGEAPFLYFGFLSLSYRTCGSASLLGWE